MPTLTPNQVETIFRDESYEAFLTTLPQQSEELDRQGFFDLFPEGKSIKGYSYYRTHIYGSYNGTSARNPGEACPPGTMAQGYNYGTAIRAEFSENRTIASEYLESVVKLGDYAAEQGEIQAKNFAQSEAEYWTLLLAYGAVSATTLSSYGVGPAGGHYRTGIYNHAIKGELGAIISELKNSYVADPDGLPWFSNVSNPHIRADGSTSGPGKTLTFFNHGSKTTGANMRLSEHNVEEVLLHMENDLPFMADGKFYSAPLPDTIVVSGNLRSLATQIIELNEYRMNTPNNDKSVTFRGSKVFGIKNIIVNRFLPDNCWYLCAKGYGIKKIFKDGKPGPVGFDGPVKGTISNIFIDMNTQIWNRQFFGYWSHMFDENMDICWYAGSTPTAVGTDLRPTAPTTASLKDWEE